MRSRLRVQQAYVTAKRGCIAASATALAIPAAIEPYGPRPSRAQRRRLGSPVLKFAGLSGDEHAAGETPAVRHAPKRLGLFLARFFEQSRKDWSGSRAE